MRCPVPSKPNEVACRLNYAAHPSEFAQPARFHAAHLFLAAPDTTPPDATEAKQTTIADLAQRLQTGADFVSLAAKFSEDEATKKRGGDLDWFSAERMPPEFIEQVAKLHPGEISAPFRTPLGFHLVRLLEAEPARALPFESVQGEIADQLRDEAHTSAIARLQAGLRVAAYTRQTP